MTNITTESLSSDGKFLWSNMLEDVKDNTTIKLPPQRVLLVLGDEESGKTTLVSYLQGTDDPKKSFALEYQYIDIKDELQDDNTKLGVYTLGGSIHTTNLIKYAVNEFNYGEAMALIVVSMQEPWLIMDSLHKWYDVLRIHSEHLRIDPLSRDEYKRSLIQYFQEYVDPSNQVTEDGHNLPLLSTRRHVNPLHPQSSSNSSATNAVPASPVDQNQDSILLPLQEGILEHNLGIPIVVIITKTDLIDSLSKEYNLTEEHFEVIQMHIRRFCLARGAALFYVSAKEEKNCNVLKGYLKNRIYGMPFIQSAYVVDKDSVFVPTGWDSFKKIQIIEENLIDLRGKTKFNECIPKPIRCKPSGKDADVAAIDEQRFLECLARELEKNNTRSVVSADMDHSHSRNVPSRPTAASQVAAMKTMKASPMPVNKDGSGVLADFFNNLLKNTNSPNKPGTTTAPISSMSPMSMPNDSAENGGASLSDVDS